MTDKHDKHMKRKRNQEEDLHNNVDEWNAEKTMKKKQIKLWKAEKRLKKLSQEEDRKKKVIQEEEAHLDIKQDSGRKYTVSIALPGSILDNAQSMELRTYLAGQIARSAVVFNIDEIVIFDESGSTERTTEGFYDGIGKKGRANVQMARILQYLECPQYLRKSFFPMHKDLQYAGLLNPLDCPHHMRSDDRCPYREGVVLNKNSKPGKGSFVDAGLHRDVQIDRKLKDGIRVTLKIDKYEDKKTKGTVVSPAAPRTEAGLYWGYSVRMASSLSTLFTESPYTDGYDLTIGTSDKGTHVDDLTLQDFSHMLVVFGGLDGLEASLESDEALPVDDPQDLFQHYVNSCPNQGSRTIRTEEAILITMAALRPKINNATTNTKTNIT